VHRAVAYGRSPAIVRRLLEAGGDPNVTDDRGLTPLRSAVRHGREDLAGLLRAAGADVTKVVPEDRTASSKDPDVLCDAASRNDVDAMRRLLEAGAEYGSDALGTTIHGSVNCHDVRGDITMKLAEEITHGDYPAVAEVLIAGGARLPESVRGSEAVQDALHRAGVPDPD